MWDCIEQPYQGFSAQGVFVDLPHGASSRTVARLLKQSGVIRSALAFEVYARRHPRRRLQAGEYFFDHPSVVTTILEDCRRPHLRTAIHRARRRDHL